MKTRTRGIGLAIVSAASFSSLGLFAKLIYAEGFSVSAALAWRFLVAAGVLWGIVCVTRRPLPRKPWPVIALGLAGFAPQAGLYFLTVSILDPGITSLLLYLYPSFVVLFGLVLFRKRPSATQVFALALSLLGCVVTFWKRGDYPLIGLALGVLVGIAYGAYLAVGERILKGVDSISATAIIMSVAALVYWAFALAGGELSFPASWKAVAGIAGLSCLATVLPITTLFAAMGRIGAAEASLVSTLEPVLTVLLSALLLGESLGLSQIVGGALILAAVLTLDVGARARPPRAARRG